jgi:hypothetical protein
VSAGVEARLVGVGKAKTVGVGVGVSEAKAGGLAKRERSALAKVRAVGGAEKDVSSRT